MATYLCAIVYYTADQARAVTTETSHPCYLGFTSIWEQTSLAVAALSGFIVPVRCYRTCIILDRQGL
ncbi:hypothetical protein SAMN05660330_03014 [Desulforhopalus singaporensis]|uniref:Uncharacterized protein n=1 Tax=Desulforhopalus singaporensis TaxID=91360 RepID=A0A1H0TD28_9BACT|nr:hypothetical protein SAMN05660330_03014 [Desulforhopalus singaporensis]